jgi:hypothetical protein
MSARISSTVCSGVWSELSIQCPTRGVSSRRIRSSCSTVHEVLFGEAPDRSLHSTLAHLGHLEPDLAALLDLAAA